MLRKCFLLILAVIGCFLKIEAQSDFLLHAHTLSPHQLLVNPSVMPDAEFYLGLPFVGNSYAGFSNNSFTYRDLIQRKSGTDSIFFNFDSYLAALRKDNFIYAGGVTDLVSIGWREGRWYVGARISEVVDFRLRFADDLMELAVNGNGPYLGTLLQLGNIHLKGSHYRKYAVNVSRDIGCKLRIGASLAWLYGMENINVKKSNVTLLTDPITFDLNGTSDILIQTSGLQGYNRDSLSSWPYLFQRRNRGASVDFGASYRFNEKMEFSASVLDFGFITWKNKSKSYSNSAEDFSFSGIPINDFIGTSLDSIETGLNRYLDSLSNIFSIQEQSISQYTTALPARFYLSAGYEINTGNTIRLTYLGNTFRSHLYSSASLSYTKNFNDILEFSLLWAYHNRTAANLGAGVTLNLGLTQFNLYTDHLPGVFGAYSSRGTNLRAGITLVSDYGNERPDYCDRDRDGIPNKRDECPDDPGTMEMMGCPDYDQDGIPDKHDECPDEAGLLNMNGCPDKDGDGIVDKNDLCPELAGPADRGGCPDSDNDGVNDDKDLCPTEPGVAYLKGCPDMDGDSIPDGEDKCPDKAGPAKFGGCPDSDGDQTPDQFDECPDKPGLAMYNGCPDTDGDGIPDQHDRCPDQAGEKANRGCPDGDKDGDGIKDTEDKGPEIAGTRANKGCPESPDKAKQIVETAVAELEFKPGKAVISPSSYESLDRLIELLRKKPAWKMKISGHTDNTGDSESNMELSRDRARSAAIYLISGGIKGDQLEIEWFGQTRPIADNKTEAGRRKNRRVEMKLLQ
jgi:outer membrane protein OmpA-like peptidoglycan-associated protein